MRRFSFLFVLGAVGLLLGLQSAQAAPDCERCDRAAIGHIRGEPASSAATIDTPDASAAITPQAAASMQSLVALAKRSGLQELIGDTCDDVKTAPNPTPGSTTPAASVDHNALFCQRVAAFVEFFTKKERGRNIYNSWHKAKGRYEQLIVDRLKVSELPPWLLYVAMIESGFDPLDATGGKGAAGLWQFMPEGGRIFGLQIDSRVDERKDPLQSTEAVVHYFHALYNRYNNWQLALAAFNVGYGAVDNMVKKHNTNSYARLSWEEAGLPEETRMYVPKILAAALVGLNAKQFEFQDDSVERPISLVTLQPARPLSIKQVADELHIDPKQLAQLNPHLTRGWLTRGKINGQETWPNLHLPASVGDTAKQRIAQLALPTEKQARQGETWDSLAVTTGISAEALQKWNGFSRKEGIPAGAVVFLPSKPDSVGTSATTEKMSPPVVVLREPAQKPNDRKPLFYQVVSGDNLSTIADAFGVALSALVQWNGLEKNGLLKPGIVLQVWVPPAFDASKVVLVDPKQVVLKPAGSDEYAAAVELTTRGRIRFAHTCDGKQTLADVAARYEQFGMTVASIQRINAELGGIAPVRSSDSLAKGTVLVLYRPASESEKQQGLAALSKQTWGSLHPDAPSTVATAGPPASGSTSDGQS